MEHTYVLVRSNFRDESEHMPIAVSENKDWLIKKIPDDFEEMEGFIPTYAGKHGEYFEVRQCENITDEPYNGFDINSLTKKAFKEFASIHVYGRGKGRRVCLFLDWRNDFEAKAIGYKYMLKGYGVTQKQILDDGYEILVNKDNSALCWYDIKVAKKETDRFKVSIVG